MITWKQREALVIKEGQESEMTNLARPRLESMQDVEEVCPWQDEIKTPKIGHMMDPNIRRRLINFLAKTHKAFSWGPKEMPGIPQEVAIHHLNVLEEITPIKQRKRTFVPERRAAAEEEVRRMLKASFI